MFKYTKRRGGKGEATRRQLLEAALELFRTRGYEGTTMRAIAEHAGLSLGAAYHYFDSKDAILLEYYEWTEAEHERVLSRTVTPSSGLRERIVALFEAKLSVVRKDRKLLAAIFARLGDPSDPLSVFGKKTSALRKRSIAQFARSLSDVPLPPDLKDLVGRLLWLAHLTVLLFFVHDRSPRQVRTRDLMAVIADFSVGALPWLALPHAAEVRNRLFVLAAGLTPARRSVP